MRGPSYEFRKVIPPRARAAFGVVTYSRSFGAVSRKEAEHRAAECRKICDRLIAEASNQSDPTAPLRSLKVRGRVPEKADIDRAVRAWVLEQERQATGGAVGHEALKQRIIDLQRIAELTPVHLREDRWSSLLTTQWVAEGIADAHQWSLSRRTDMSDYLLDRVGRAQRESALRLKAELNFEDPPSPTHGMFSNAAFEEDRASPKSVSVPIMDLLEGYLSHQQVTAKTAKKWRTALSSLIEHMGHDNAADMLPSDIIGWKNALLVRTDGGEQRSAATVRNGYLGAAKAVFAWAKDNRKIEANPVAGVTVKVPRRVTNRPERGYSDAEARVVLGAAFATDCQGDESYGAFARRWLPWLCAYSGARVAEMAQLRQSDVTQSIDGIWHITIKPEAGSQKSGQARHVVLHPHLIEQGFPEAIKGRSGALFFDPTRKRAGSTGNSQAQKAASRVAEWVRKLGLTDKELQPNHGWRHAFITNARGKIDEDIRRAIVGHSSKSEHGNYGNVTLRDMQEALTRFPRYRV
jgi:integrase